MSRGFWLGLVGVALVRAAVPQISTVVVPSSNVNIPAASVAVTITGVSDFSPSGKIQIKLPDGTVAVERTYLNAAAATPFTVVDSAQNSYKIEDTFTFPGDSYVAASGAATWSVFASLSNVNGSADTTQAAYSALTTTFPVTVTAGPAFVTTAACAAKSCPGSATVIPANPSGTYSIAGRSFYQTGVPPVSVPTSYIKASSTAPLSPTNVEITNAAALSAGTAATGACHILDSVITNPTPLTLQAPLCLVNSQISLSNWAAASNQFIRGIGSSKVIVQSGQGVSITNSPDFNVLVQNSGVFTVTNPANFVSKGKFSQIDTNAQLVVTGVLTCNLESSSAVCLELLQGTVQGASRIDVKVGVVRVNTGKQTNVATYRVGSAPAPTSKTVAQQQSTQIGGPGASFVVAPYSGGGTTYGCGPATAINFFSTLELYQNGAVFISQNCAANPAITVTNPFDSTSYRVAAMGDTLDFKGGKLVFLDAKQNGAVLNLNSNLVKSGSSGTIEVQLSSENMPTTAFKIYLLRYGSADCNKQITTTILNQPEGRPAMQGCQTDATSAWFYVSIPAAAAVVATNQTQARPFQSQNKYYVTLGKECGTVSEATFRKDVASVGLDADAISDFTLTCGSVIVTFTCRDSSSSANADATCQSIIDQANSGLLRTPWNTQSTSVVPLNKGSASNTGLYALFVLVLVPIFCVFCICLLLRNKRRRADNQYKQDTATFANVASSPQPINYPYPYAGDLQQAPYGFADVAKPAIELQAAGTQAPYGY